MNPDSTNFPASFLPVLSVAVAIASLQGCLLYGGPGRDYHDAPADAPPVLTYTDSTCYFDAVSRDNPDGYNDYVWTFEADTTDPDGPLDVTSVYADVYDDATGDWIDGFDLYADSDTNWYSAWVQSSTYLDCTYLNYSVDITAEDSVGETVVQTLIPAQSP